MIHGDRISPGPSKYHSFISKGLLSRNNCGEEYALLVFIVFVVNEMVLSTASLSCELERELIIFLVIAQGVTCKDPLLDRFSCDELLVDESIDFVFRHSGIPVAFGVNDQDRSPLADSQALDFGSVAGSGIVG